ncbi:MAG: peptidoglycan-associated lipoprotein Pal [Verrucomicrobia bacterium]|nr:peptidoglycan-associated lipoprotein Pal [Deltaproteobacteria bacterium]
MLKRESFYIVALFFVAVFMTAGCASQNVVKKDEGFVVPTPVAKQADQPTSGVTQSNQATITPAIHSPSPAPARQAQDALSSARLQSALKKIYFDFDSSDLSESARDTLTNNNAALIKGSSAKIRIEGNCDESGSAEYNLALGERRARSAQQYLIALGVEPDRLATISYGKEKPAVKGSDETALAKNRRDEFVVVSQ